jgi:hypothetical protein
VTSSADTGPPGGDPEPRAGWWARLGLGLGRGWWLGIGAVAAILGVVITVVTLLIGSGGGSVDSNTNHGPCSGVGNGNSVVCTEVGNGTSAGTSP